METKKTILERESIFCKKTRKAKACPFCYNEKTKGTLMCWRCWNVLKAINYKTPNDYLFMHKRNYKK